MEQLELAELAIAAALAWGAGLRAYAVIFAVGLAGAMGWIELPGHLDVLEQPVVLGADADDPLRRRHVAPGRGAGQPRVLRLAVGGGVVAAVAKAAPSVLAISLPIISLATITAPAVSVC